MKFLYYLTAVLLTLYFIAQIFFDLWIYKSTRCFDFVLDVWMNRHKKQFSKLTPNQQMAQKYLCRLERIAITFAVFIFVVELIDIGVRHG